MIGKKMRALGALISGVAVIAAGSALAVGGVLVEPAALGDPSSVLHAGQVRATEGRMSIICVGGVERAVAESVNVADAQEQISGQALAFVHTDGAQNTDTRWLRYGAQSPAASPAADDADDAGDARTTGDTAAGDNASAGNKADASNNANAASADLAASAGTPVMGNVIGAAQAQPSGLGVAALTGELSVARSEGSTALLAGGNAHRAAQGDLRGLAYNACAWPTNSAWLVGSATTVGNSNRLIVANASRTSVSIKIQAFTSVGEVPLGASSVVLLPAQSVRSVVLDGLVPEDERVAFHLSADSGQFAAAIQSTSLAGFTPAGIEFLQAGRAGNELIIPGLYLPAGTRERDALADGTESTTSTLVDSAVTSSVRIVNPGKEKRTINVALIGTDGQVSALPGSNNVEVTAGGVLDLSLAGVQPGDYSVRVTADGLIAAGAAVHYAAGAAGADVQWLAAQSPVTSASAGVGIGTARLLVTPEVAGKTTRTAAVTWQAYGANGEQLASETVTAKGTIGVAMPKGTAAVSVHSDVPVYAALSLTADLGNGTGAAFSPLTVGGAASAAVTILFAN